MSKLSLINPNSVIKLAPSSGVFSRQDLSENEFTAIVMERWMKRSTQADNALSETPQHFEAARELYDFYKIYRATKTDRKSKGGALYKLYSQGSIKEAAKELLKGKNNSTICHDGAHR